MNNCYNDNYDLDSEQIDEFRDSAKRIEEFERTLLCLHCLVNLDNFCYAILYVICYQFKNKKDERQNDDEQKQNLGNDNL